jgi:AcrR family transcriptional regulator
VDEPNTRERILLEAEGQFVANGIEKTQMMEIAKACGINRRTLYRYFPTKDLLAFQVEMIVMDRIQAYMSALVDEKEFTTGIERVTAYFERVELNRIWDWMRFTAEFDRYFQNDYPNGDLTKRFIENLNPAGDPLQRFIRQGIADGTIRIDLTAEEIYQFISQNFFAFYQRLILRRNHLKYEYCAEMNFEAIFKKVILKAIKA